MPTPELMADALAERPKSSVDWLQQYLPTQVGDWLKNSETEGLKRAGQLTPKNVAGEMISGALNLIPAGRFSGGPRALASKADAFWQDVKPQDAKLSGEPARAVDAWVGGPHNSIEQGLTGGLMIPGRLENMPPAQWAEMAKPIQGALREQYGDIVPAYRVEGIGGQSTGRQNKLFSYSTDRGAAERYAGVGRDRPLLTEKEITQAERQFAKTGEVSIGGRMFRNEDGSVNMYDRHGGHITDTPSVRAELETINSDRANYNALNEGARNKVKSANIPVDDVVWATDRFNQKELIRFLRDKKVTHQFGFKPMPLNTSSDAIVKALMDK